MLFTATWLGNTTPGMKVFISWSGTVSRQVAELLRDWLPNVLQSAEAWVSSEDIEKGEIWFGALSQQLSEVKIGVLCLTRESMPAPWLLFEAGGLSKGLSKNRVCNLLISLEPTDVIQPLAQFQATKPIREDMLKLVKTINAAEGEKALTETRLQIAFDRWWGDFDARYKAIVSAEPQPKTPQRNPQEVMDEILQLARSVHSMMQEASTARITLEEAYQLARLGKANDIRRLLATPEVDMAIDYARQLRGEIFTGDEERARRAAGTVGANGPKGESWLESSTRAKREAEEAARQQKSPATDAGGPTTK